jgi:excisionase family DNA binding protein
MQFPIDPNTLAQVPPEEIPAIMAQLAAIQSALAVRLHERAISLPESAPTSEPDRAITVEEAAGRLSFTSQYVYELIKRRQIPAIRTGKYVRIRECDLSAWMARHIDNPLDNKLYNLYSLNHERTRPRKHPKEVGTNTGSAGRPNRRVIEHRGAVGAGRVEDIRTHIAVHSTDSRDGMPE